MHHLNQLTQSLYWSYFLYTVYVGKTRYLKTWVCLCSKIHVTEIQVRGSTDQYQKSIVMIVWTNH